MADDEQILPNAYSLKRIASELGVSYKQLHNWARPNHGGRKANNGFPEPAAILGRYLLYDIDEVRKWYTLWQRVTENATGPHRGMNGHTEDGSP